MNTVVQFYRKGPPNVVINGEQIPEAAIAEAMIDYADAPKPREAAVRSLVVRTLQELAAAGELDAGEAARAAELYHLNDVSAGASGTVGGDSCGYRPGQRWRRHLRCERRGRCRRAARRSNALRA